MKPAELGQAVVELLQREGWRQKAYDTWSDEKQKYAGPYCLAGAMHEVCNDLRAVASHADYGVYQKFKAALQESLRQRDIQDYNIIRWNDEQGRTLDEVIGLVRETVELLKQQGEQY